MRFCPFCAQENPDDARECGHCGKRLPPPRTAPPRAVPAPPVAERPKKEIPARPAPRSMPLKGAEPLPDRPLESGAEVAPRDSFDLSGPTTVSPRGAQPAAPMPNVTSTSTTLSDQPLPEIKGEKTQPHVPPKAPSGTLLGVPTPGATPVTPMGRQESERRETKPISVS